MEDDEAFNEYSRTLLSSRNLMYNILTILEQQEQTLQRLAITSALRRASQVVNSNTNSVSDEETDQNEISEPPRQRRRTTIYRRTTLQSPIRSNVTFRRPPVQDTTPSPPAEAPPEAPHTEPADANNDSTEEDGIPIPRPTRPAPAIGPLRPSLRNRANPISDLFTQAILNTLGQLSPVRVTPTASQIERSTERLVFGDLPSDISRYQTCPICHDAFTADSEILRIRHCGHYFGREAILTWFDMNCHCPICRHDIREGLSPSTSSDNGESHHEEYLEDSPVNQTTVPIRGSEAGLSTFVDAITQDLQRRNTNIPNGGISYSFEFVPTVSADLRPRRASRSSYPDSYPNSTSTGTTRNYPDHLTSSFDIPNNTTSYTPTAYTSTYSRDYARHNNYINTPAQPENNDNNSNDGSDNSR